MENKHVKLYWEKDGKVIHTESVHLLSNIKRHLHDHKRPVRFDLTGLDGSDLNDGRLRYWIYTDLYELING